MSDLCPRHNCEPQPSHLGMFCPECLREGHFGSDEATKSINAGESVAAELFRFAMKQLSE